MDLPWKILNTEYNEQTRKKGELQSEINKRKFREGN